MIYLKNKFTAMHKKEFLKKKKKLFKTEYYKHT